MKFANVLKTSATQQTRSGERHGDGRWSATNAKGLARSLTPKVGRNMNALIVGRIDGLSHEAIEALLFLRFRGRYLPNTGTPRPVR